VAAYLRCVSRLKLVSINALYLFGLDAQIIEGLPFRGMVEADHQFGQTAPERNPLVVSPSFVKGMAPIISFQINGPAPLLDESVDGRDGKRPPLPREDRLIVGIVPGFHESIDRIDTGLIQADSSPLSGLLLFQHDLIHRFYIPIQEPLDSLDVLHGHDRLNPDFVARLRMIRVWIN